MKKVVLAMALTLMGAMQLNAQKRVADKELIGAWMLEYMQYDGEKKIECGKDARYSSFKYYGADGEYACCEIVLSNDGRVVLMPHEYGKYTYKNGVYSEMGRPAVKPEDMKMIDATHFKGRWKNRTESWRKVALPEKAVKHIVNCCKTKDTPTDIQQMIKQSIFK